MISQYELILVIKADAKSEDVVSGAKKLIVDKKGKILDDKSWGKKLLAYKIKKASEGIYHYVLFTLLSTDVITVTDKLKVNEDILRFLVVEKPIDKKALRKQEALDKKNGKVPKVVKEEKVEKVEKAVKAEKVVKVEAKKETKTEEKPKKKKSKKVTKE